MARLSSNAATITIQPRRRETPASNWLETEVGIVYHILEQRFDIRLPAKAVSIQKEELQTFVARSRGYITSLPIKPHTKGYERYTYHFSPLEPNFSFELNSGSFFDQTRTEGSIAVSFRLSLRGLGITSLSDDDIGCDFTVSIIQLMAFLDQLEGELQVLPPRL